MEYQDFTPGDENEEILKEETQKAIMQFFEYMEKKQRKMIDYMEKEGFIESTDIPGVYKYTPEGLAVMQEKFKQFKKNGH